MRARDFLLFVTLAGVAASASIEPAARALVPPPILHEPIPPDPREDLALDVTLEGNLPAAIQTPSGLVSAPDPRRPPSPSDAAYGPGSDHDAFAPDRDTQRPEVAGYDEPFTPSTAPFKRMEAFDAVKSDYRLVVADDRLAPVPQATAADDDKFFADLVVDVAPGRNVRIPSVGPGARVVRGHLGAGADDVAFRVMRDGADNWFLQADALHGAVRARLVMEVAIVRAVFGGQFGDPAWGDLPAVPALPDNVARSAAEVQGAIGVGRDTLRPRQAVAKLVDYFRSFADSDVRPSGHGDVYLDLALSKKGVCRHRAFAFMVTALGLGIPTRFVMNEAHAWVEVHDGTIWRRIDLGGAGHMTNPASNALPERAVYRPPPDAFAWPQTGQRGDDMVADARARAMSGGGNGGGGGGGGGSGLGSGADGGSGTAAGTGTGEERAETSLTLTVDDADAHRGLPLHVRGDVRADSEACAHVAVDLWLRDVKTQKMFALGTLATGDDGAFAGGIVVAGSVPLGEYDVVARTPGDARCGAGATQ